ncbi:MAG TPA: transporter [Rhodocyclaceae bacterium]|nr:transporter [Rhodocyclaceae bacterium]
MKNRRPLSQRPLLSLLTLAALAPFGVAQAAGTTTVSVGLDFASGEYGTTETTDTYTAPVSVKYANGPWLLRATLPLVHVEGTFSRDLGFEDPSEDTPAGVVQGKRSETGLGDLTVAAHYTLIDNPDGFSLDLGGKAKIATADKDKTLITSGENDYSVQVDLFRSMTDIALFATLGYTIKGEPAGVTYKDPFYASLGLSVPVTTGQSVGAAWDYRQKVVTNGDPISEVSVFYSYRLDPHNKMQFYAVGGLADGSPDFGGGVVLTHSY